MNIMPSVQVPLFRERETQWQFVLLLQVTDQHIWGSFKRAVVTSLSSILSCINTVEHCDACSGECLIEGRYTNTGF